MPPSPKPPRVDVRRVEESRSDQERDGWSAYRIYAGNDVIGKLAGTGEGVVFSWPGEIPRDMWRRENIAPLFRAVLSARTHGLSDQEIAARTEVLTFGVGPELIDALTAMDGGAIGLPVDWDVSDPRNLKLHGRTRLDHVDGSYRLAVAMGEVQGAITHLSAAEVELDGRNVSIPPEIFVTHDPKLPWGVQTMEFLKQHHSHPIVSSIDAVLLAVRITDASRLIAVQSSLKGQTLA
jgi:hypothetical protein